MKLFFLITPLLFTFISCSPSRVSTPDFSPAPSITSQETLRIAESFRVHQWTANEKNIKHGLDADGILVNTPDTTMADHVAARPGWWKPNTINQGIPYKWGGFDTPLSYDLKLKQGYFAGDVYTKQKRRKLWNGVSNHAAGVDCSGFVSRCWRLDKHHSTRELPSITTKLSSYNDLKPGDIVHKYNAHVLLFAYFVNPEKTIFMAYETGSAPSWKVLRHKISVSYVKNLGYIPRRYTNIKSQ